MKEGRQEAASWRTGASVRWRRFAGLVAGLWMSLAAVGVGAQEPERDAEKTHWSLSLESGIQELASRDELGSPLGYEGLAVPLTLRTDLENPGWSAGVRLSGVVAGFNAGQLTAARADEEPGGHRADPVFVDLSSWLQWPVVESARHQLEVGPQLGHWTFFRSYMFHPSQIGSVEVWEATITADVRARISGEFDRWGWEIATSLAVGGRMLRPNYSVRGDDRVALVEQRRRVLGYGDWTALHRLQHGQLGGGLNWRPTDRWGVTGRYRAGVLWYRGQELTTRAFTQQGTVGVEFRFR